MKWQIIIERKRVMLKFLGLIDQFFYALSAVGKSIKAIQPFLDSKNFLKIKMIY